MTDRLTIIEGDARERLKELAAESVHCVVTSPPYYGLRDYGVDGQIGLEASPDEYVSELVKVFREVKRVLRNDGTVWLNLGDSYMANRGNTAEKPGFDNKAAKGGANLNYVGRKNLPGLKNKDLIGIPWLVAFALRADGWYLRSDIIWSKPNPMPESVTDRPTKSHEYIFLLSKSQSYYYDAEAIKESAQNRGEADEKRLRRCVRDVPRDGGIGRFTRGGGSETGFGSFEGRNRRSVWTVTTNPYSGAHFATFPPDLIKPCILAGCPVDGVVLDPFAGSGTTGKVALELGRRAILIELNPKYLELIERRCSTTYGLPLAGEHDASNSVEVLQAANVEVGHCQPVSLFDVDSPCESA